MNVVGNCKRSNVTFLFLKINIANNKHYYKKVRNNLKTELMEWQAHMVRGIFFDNKKNISAVKRFNYCFTFYILFYMLYTVYMKVFYSDPPPALNSFCRIFKAPRLLRHPPLPRKLIEAKQKRLAQVDFFSWEICRFVSSFLVGI